MSTAGLLRSMKAKLGGGNSKTKQPSAETHEKEPVVSISPPTEAHSTLTSIDVPATTAFVGESSPTFVDHSDPPLSADREAMLKAYKGNPIPRTTFKTIIVPIPH